MASWAEVEQEAGIAEQAATESSPWLKPVTAWERAEREAGVAKAPEGEEPEPTTLRGFEQRLASERARSFGGVAKRYIERPIRLVTGLGDREGRDAVLRLRRLHDEMDRTGTIADQADREWYVTEMDYRTRKKPVSGQVAEVLFEAVPYAQDILLGGAAVKMGLRAGFKLLGRESIEAGIKRLAERNIATRLATRGMTGAAALAVAEGAKETASVLGLPVSTRAAQDFQEEMLATKNRYGLDSGGAGEMLAALLSDRPEVVDAAKNSLFRQVIEGSSEMLGGELGRLPILNRVAALQHMAVSRLLGNGVAVPEALEMLGRGVAYEGLFQQILEERASDVMMAAAGLQPWSKAIPELEQIAVELAAFATPGIAAIAAAKVMGQPAGTAPGAERGAEAGPATEIPESGLVEPGERSVETPSVLRQSEQEPIPEGAPPPLEVPPDLEARVASAFREPVEGVGTAESEPQRVLQEREAKAGRKVYFAHLPRGYYGVALPGGEIVLRRDVGFRHLEQYAAHESIHQASFARPAEAKRLLLELDRRAPDEMAAARAAVLSPERAEAYAGASEDLTREESAAILAEGLPTVLPRLVGDPEAINAILEHRGILRRILDALARVARRFKLDVDGPTLRKLRAALEPDVPRGTAREAVVRMAHIATLLARVRKLGEGEIRRAPDSGQFASQERGDVEEGARFAAEPAPEEDIPEEDIQAEMERLRGIPPEQLTEQTRRRTDRPLTETAYTEAAAADEEMRRIRERRARRRAVADQPLEDIFARHDERAVSRERREMFESQDAERRARLESRLEDVYAQRLVLGDRFSDLGREITRLEATEGAERAKPDATAESIHRLGQEIVSVRRLRDDVFEQFIVLGREVIDTKRRLRPLPSPFSERPTETEPPARFSYTPPDSPEFKRWFGDSKVVDADGKPLVVYHGARGTLTSFDVSRAGENTGSGTSQLGGAFFTPDPSVASRYAEFDGVRHDGGNVLPVYLSIRNPYRMPLSEFLELEDMRGEFTEESLERLRAAGRTTRARIESMGHDGIVIASERSGPAGRMVEYVVFRPNQIKSATGNRGTFSPDSPDIRYSFNLDPLPKTIEAVELPPVSARSLDAARRAIQDQALPIQRWEEEIAKAGGWTEKSLRDAISLYPGRLQGRHDELEKLSDRIKAIARRAKWWGEGPERASERIGETLYALAAPERNAFLERTKGLQEGSGMSDEEAQTILDENLALPGMRQIVDTARQIAESTRDQMAETGLISEETLEFWRETFPNYFPLRTAEMDAEGPAWVGPRGRGYQVTGAVVRAMEGRRSKADNPLVFLLAQATSMNLAAEKARVGQRMWEVLNHPQNAGLISYTELEPPPDPSEWTETEAFGLWVDGERRVIKLSSPDVNRAMKALGYAPVPPLLRLHGQFVRLLSRLTTSWNPDFVLPNFTRDLGTAMVNVSAERVKGARRGILRSLPGSLRAIAGHELGREPTTALGRYYQDVYRKEGGLIGWARDVTYEQMRADLLKDMSRGLVGRTLGSIIGALESVNAVVEQGVRVATAYELERLGVPREKAIRAAREISVDFNRRGEWTSNMSAYKMFVNASIQGAAQILINLKRSPRIGAIGAGIAAVAFGQAIANFYAMGDDDDGENRYLKKPDWERDTTMMFPNPASDDPGDMLKMPLPYGYNVFWVIGDRLAEAVLRRTAQGEATGESMNRLATRVAKAAWEGFSPVSESSLLQMLAPQALVPIVQIAENRDWKGDPIMPDGNPFDPAPPPDSERAWKSVTPLAQDVARYLNRMFGGNQFRGGSLLGMDMSVSPESLEHLLESYAGGLGKVAENTTKLASKPWSETGWTKVPVLRRFYSEPSMFADRGTFYSNVEEVNRAAKEVKGLGENAPERARREAALIGAAKAATKRAKELREGHEAATDPAARERIEGEMQKLYLEFNAEFNKTRSVK